MSDVPVPEISVTRPILDMTLDTFCDSFRALRAKTHGKTVRAEMMC